LAVSAPPGRTRWSGPEAESDGQAQGRPTEALGREASRGGPLFVGSTRYRPNTAELLSSIWMGNFRVTVTSIGVVGGLVLFVLQLAFVVVVIWAIVAIFQIRTSTHQMADRLDEILRRMDEK
jgi:hypothetical protein